MKSTIKIPTDTSPVTIPESISYDTGLSIPGFSSVDHIILPKTPVKRDKIKINTEMRENLIKNHIDITTYLNLIKNLNKDSDYSFVVYLKTMDHRDLNSLTKFIKINPENKNILKYIKNRTKQRAEIGYKKDIKYHFHNKYYRFIPDSEDPNMATILITTGEKFKPYHMPLLPLINDMKKYLDKTKMEFHKHHMSDGSYLTIPTSNRWSPKNKFKKAKGIQQLKASYAENQSASTMLTFTTDMKYDIIESFVNLSKGVRKILDNIIKNHPKVDYIGSFEPHKSGYAHLHLVVFDEISIEEQDNLKRLWAFKYKLGSYKHGLTFSTKTSQTMVDSKFDHTAAFDGAINYAFEYQFKMLDEASWKLKDWMFNCALRYTNKKSLISSKNVKKIMKINENDFEKDEIGFWTVFETDMSLPIVMKITYHRDEDDVDGCIVWERHPDYNEIFKNMLARLEK